ncbi:MAG: hypothetical protein AAF623_15270 [Planctomycetota bacterium]
MFELNCSATSIQRFRIFGITFLVWFFLAGMASVKVASIGNPIGTVAWFWLSPLAGSFAFAEQVMFLQDPVFSFLVGLSFASLSFAHPVHPSFPTAVMTVCGISVWCLIGLAITYVGV